MYSSFDIAKKILKLAKKDGVSVDTMKLLKLVYITHGWYLGFNEEPLISDEIQAWKYGPVIQRSTTSSKGSVQALSILSSSIFTQKRNLIRRLPSL